MSFGRRTVNRSARSAGVARSSTSPSADSRATSVSGATASTTAAAAATPTPTASSDPARRRERATARPTSADQAPNTARTLSRRAHGHHTAPHRAVR